MTNKEPTTKRETRDYIDRELVKQVMADGASVFIAVGQVHIHITANQLLKAVGGLLEVNLIISRYTATGRIDYIQLQGK